MKNVLKFLSLSLLVLLMTSTVTTTSMASATPLTLIANNEIAKVTVSNDTNNNYLMSFSLRENKKLTQAQFTSVTNRWIPQTIATGALLSCSFDENTQEITATFDGASMATEIDTDYMNSFFKRFGYTGGYTIL